MSNKGPDPIRDLSRDEVLNMPTEEYRRVNNRPGRIPSYQDALNQVITNSSTIQYGGRSAGATAAHHHAQKSRDAWRRTMAARDAWRRTMAALDPKPTLDRLKEQRAAEDYLTDNGQQHMIIELNAMIRLMDVLEVAVKYGVPEGGREPLSPGELNHLLVDVNAAIQNNWNSAETSRYVGYIPGGMPTIAATGIIVALTRLGMLP